MEKLSTNKVCYTVKFHSHYILVIEDYLLLSNDKNREKNSFLGVKKLTVTLCLAKRQSQTAELLDGPK